MREAQGNQVKLYAIVHPATGRLCRENFESGMLHALSDIPPPAVDEGRPGLGLVIWHQGRSSDYMITCWWDLYDELSARVLVRHGAEWQRAVRESFCVWDLDIMWFERCAYVATILGGAAEPAAAYLACVMQSSDGGASL